MSGPIAQMARAFGISQKIGGWVEIPSGREIFCPQNFDAFTRKSVRVSKINAVARAQLTFQMLTLLNKYHCTKLGHIVVMNIWNIDAWQR